MTAATATTSTTSTSNNILTLDWAPAESQCNNFLNSDLFGGDLFGDELIDMYSSVSDDDPEVTPSTSIISGEVVSMNSDNLSALDVLSSYNDITLLLPSNPEPFSASSNHKTAMAAASTTTTTLPLTVPTIPIDLVSSDEGTNVAVVALPTKIPIIKKKLKASGGGSKKRKITTVGQVQHHTRCVSGLSFGNSVAEWVSSDSSGTTDLSNAVFGGAARFHPSTNMNNTRAEPNTKPGKRTKFSGSVQVEGAKAAAALRKAALAAAVSQYAPLAASQVSKIRQNASILEKSIDRNEIVKSVLKVVNPLDQLKNSPSPTIPPEQQQQQPMKLPTSPNSAPVTGTPSGMESSPVSPGVCKTRYPIVPSSAIPGMTSGANIPSDIKPVTSNIPEMKVPSATVTSLGCPFTSESTLPPATSHKPGENGSTSKVSTAHVNSLTSANWSNTEAATTAVPAAPVSTATFSSTSNKGSQSAQGPKRRASLTVEDRAKQNRDRNREHARNTRLRKKAYVDELKKTLTEIVSQRDSQELEKIQNMELRNVRFSVLQEFFKLRCSNEQDWIRWSTILDNNFMLRLPVTQYGKMNPSSNNNTGSKVNHYYQEINGIADVMNDAMMISEMMLSFQVECDKSSFMMDGTSAMLCWTLKTTGCISQGASHELNVIGSLRASFDASTNKLTSVELFYDTNGFFQQLQSMYPTAFSGEDTSGSTDEAADETAALLDSLNVPQYEGFLNEASHFIASDSSSDKNEG